MIFMMDGNHSFPPAPQRMPEIDLTDDLQPTKRSLDEGERLSSGAHSKSGLEGLPDVLNSREAASVLRMGVKELRQLIERGELPAARLGPRGMIRIAKTAIVNLLRGEPRQRVLVTPPDARVEPCKPARHRWKGRPS